MTAPKIPASVGAVRLALLCISLLVGACGRFGFTELDELSPGAVTENGAGSSEAGIGGETGGSSSGGSSSGPERDGGAEWDGGAEAPGGGGLDGGGTVDGSVGVLIVEDVATPRIASGLDQSCFVRANGNVACWGFDGNGERGDGQGATTSQGVPTALVQQLSGALVGVETGYIHVCGLSSSGEAWCWGANSSGQLGIAGGRSADAPVQVRGGLRFDVLSVGSHHACAIEGGGDAFCWGRGANGRLGSGGTQDQNAPVRVAGGLKFSAVSSGGGHSCAVERGTHLAFCWGAGGSGRLGDGGTMQRNTPVRVASELTFRSVDAGTDFSCGLTFDDRALCWGKGGEGQLGDGALNDALTPVEVSGGLRFRTLTVSGETSSAFAPSPHACALTVEGTAYCWGSNEYGQLGTSTGNLPRSATPVAVDQSASGPFAAIAAGFGFTCAVDTSDAAWCWGFDGTGELGTGPGRQDSKTPLPVILP